MNALLSSDGTTLTLIIPLDPNPRLSSTGRSHILASTAGWTEIQANGRRIKLSLTAVEPLRGRGGQAASSHVQPAYNPGI